MRRVVLVLGSLLVAGRCWAADGPAAAPAPPADLTPECLIRMSRCQLLALYASGTPTACPPAGFAKGYPDTDSARCRLSTKHALALTNRGGASAADVVALARDVRDGVRDVFGVTLVPEPVLVGCSL